MYTFTAKVKDYCVTYHTCMATLPSDYINGHGAHYVDDITGQTCYFHFKTTVGGI